MQIFWYFSESSNRDLEYKRDKLTSHTERVQQLKTEANDLLARKLQLDKDLQQRQKLEENKTQLQSEHEVLNRAIQVGTVNRRVHINWALVISLLFQWMHNFQQTNLNSLKFFVTECSILWKIYKSADFS